MYPNLTPSLSVLLGVAAGVATFFALRKPFVRRLALRQISRRRTEAALVIFGSMLGTAIIVGSLIVGDTLDFSVKQVAYSNLGPIDEMVVSPNLDQGIDAQTRLVRLGSDPRVDGLLTAYGDQAAATIGHGSSLRAEPRATVWELDFTQAATFGGGRSGISGAGPNGGEVVINEDLARALHAAAGDRITFFLYGEPRTLFVTRVIPTTGMSGIQMGAFARNAFVGPGEVPAAAWAAGMQPHVFTFVSNAGDVEGGDRYSEAVAATIHRLLGPLTSEGTAVETPKHQVLLAATDAGDALGSMFLFIGSFAIIAGVMLLVVIFAMLAEERKSELGMLRAIGMKRSRLVRSFVIEGTVYAFTACLIGIFVGLAVGRGVVVVASKIFNQIPADEGGLALTFHVTWITVVNGFAMGFLIAFGTVVLTSIRISRVNIIAAIRDLPPVTGRPIARRWVIASTVLAIGCVALSASSIGASQPVGTYLFPSLAILLLCPLVMRFATARWVLTGASLAVLAWVLLANLIRPRILDNASTAAYVVMGILLTFSAVFLVSYNQGVFTSPFRPVTDRPTPSGLALRLGLAYPVARRFRTGAVLVMYSLVVFTLVLMVVLGAMINATVSREVKRASGGFAVRVDFNPSSPIVDPRSALASGRFADQVDAVVPLTVAPAKVEHLGTFTDAIDAVAVGAGHGIVEDGLFPLLKRMPSFADDRAAWQAVLSDPRYVMLDQYIGLQGGGPQGTAFIPGDTFSLVDPATGDVEQKTIAGVLASTTGFYGVGNTGRLSPVIEGWETVRSEFGSGAKVASAFLRLAPGASETAVAAAMENRFLGNGLAATSVREAVNQSMATTNGFFQLMEGFLTLGLLVGIAGLGVMMVRAVRERRRSIGVLRALGFGARTVQGSFLTESSFVALEGILIGTVLAIVTSYQLYTNFPTFQNAGGFPIPWSTIGAVVVVAAVASILVTVWPAHRAAAIRPAVALRVD